jgi:hypothetical protein
MEKVKIALNSPTEIAFRMLYSFYNVRDADNRPFGGPSSPAFFMTAAFSALLLFAAAFGASALVAAAALLLVIGFRVLCCHESSFLVVGACRNQEPVVPGSKSLLEGQPKSNYTLLP